MVTGLLGVRGIRTILIVWVALNIMDMLLTLSIGLEWELNPSMKAVYDYAGNWGFVFVKLGLTLLVVLGLYWWRRLYLLIPLIIAIGGVVLWNVGQVLTA